MQGELQGLSFKAKSIKTERSDGYGSYIDE